MSIKTLLIGLDGATFDVLDPMMQNGVMPFLQSFFANGVKAGLRSVIPALTPPAWTSLMTGRRPGDHGVFDFFRRDSPDGLHIRFFTSHDVGVDTIWSIAAVAGMRVTALNFPSMFPPPRLPGFVVPGWVPWRQLRLACWPENLFDSLKQTLPSFNPRELAMDIQLEEKATEGCADRKELAPWIELHSRREENWFDIFRALTEQQPSELTAVVFDGVDKLQHLCWPYIHAEAGEPLTEPWQNEVRELCLTYFRRLDSIIERMCAIAGPEATVLLASDHGFQASRDVFHVNAWLASLGHLAWADRAGSASNGQSVLGVGQVARHTWQLDWTTTTAFAATPTSNGISIVVKREEGSPGIAPEAYEEFRSGLIDRLLQIRHPQTGKQMVTGAHRREEIFGPAYREYAPDITLELHDGGLVSILPSQQIISQRPVMAGFHAPVGIFGAKGPGIRNGHYAQEMSILAVAPFILHRLGLAIPEDMDSGIPSDLFEPGVLERNPVVKANYATSNYAKTGGIDTAAGRMSDEDEQIVLDRLRDLGYLE